MFIVVAIIVFGVIIIVHELGHFLVAKACGVHVNEFAIGMGPTLLKWQPKNSETKYALRLLPIGGFVSMEGEDSQSEDDRAFFRKPVWQRLLVIVAGALMNIVLGFLVIVIMTVMSEAIVSTTVRQFNENAPSQKSGLQADDKLLKINGMSIFVDTDISYQFSSDEDGVFDMLVLRDGKKVELKDVTFALGKTEDGKQSISIDFKVYPQEKNVLTVLEHSVLKTASTARLIWISLVDLISGRFGMNDISGPVGVVQIIGKASAMGLSQLLGIVSFITINVGIFNLLPLPALDGGRLLFLLIEAVRRKPIKPEHEGYVHFVGFALLMGLMLFVTFNDILKLIKG